MAGSEKEDTVETTPGDDSQENNTNAANPYLPLQEWIMVYLFACRVTDDHDYALVGGEPAGGS
jgi:hypothetical protein